MFPEPPSKYWLVGCLLVLFALGVKADWAAQDAQVEAAIAADLKDAQRAALVAMRGE